MIELERGNQFVCEGKLFKMVEVKFTHTRMCPPFDDPLLFPTMSLLWAQWNVLMIWVTCVND